MPLTVTLHPLEAADGWRLHLSDPPPNLPRDIWVMLDGRPYPFHAPPPALPTHPINLLWRGTTGHPQAILAAVRAVQEGTLPRGEAEAVIAARLTAWSERWAMMQTLLRHRRRGRP